MYVSTLHSIHDLQLQSISINPASFRFGSLTMESDKYISVKDQAADGSLHVVVIDMHNNNAVTKKPMKAEATLMNTVDNVIALKGMSLVTNQPFSTR
jgi:clathrin heavy chain